MRIRRRLALYGAFVIGAGMFVFAVLLNLLAGQGAPRDQQDTLSTLAAAMGDRLASVSTDELGELAPLLPIDLQTSLDPFLAVYQEDGMVLYSTGQIGGVAPRLPAAVVVEAVEIGRSDAPVHPTASVELAVVAVRARLSDGTQVVVAAGQSAEFVEQQLVGLRVVIWAAAVITLIGATVASWLVSGRALRPLRDLVATTDDISRTGDLSRRLPAVGTDDEVGRLAVSFNSMLDSVESSQHRLSDALDAQQRFVADASHELRSPLTTIRANAGFLRDRADIAQIDRVESISDIATQADRMSRLVDDLLALARSDGGAPTAHGPVDLAVVVADAARRMQRAGNPITVDSEESAVVDGDGDALARLVWALVENAVVHGAPPVTVQLERSPGSVTLGVADRGPGLLPADLDKIFERFYRADPARSPAGSGLGLAIVKDIVELHGGSVDAANRDEGGVVVTVTFLAR